MKCLIVAMSVLLVASLAPPPAAWAATDDQERAKTLYEEAKALHDAGLLREAMGKLKQAYDLSPDDGILMSIVNRHMEMGEPEEAAAMLSLLKPKTPQMRAQADELQRKITAAMSEPVTVQITAIPDNAEVAVDGGTTQQLPATVRLTRGVHSFAFKAAGHDKKVVKRELSGSNVVQLEVQLNARFGRWQVKLEPEEPFDDVRVLFDEVQVLLSRRERDAFVSRARSVRPGTYQVTCLRGVDDYVETLVEVVSDETRVAVCRFPEEPIGLNEIVAWSSAGAAVAAFAGGTAMYVSYRSDVDKYENNPKYRGFETSKDVGAYALFGTGAVLTAASVLIFTEILDLEAIFGLD